MRKKIKVNFILESIISNCYLNTLFMAYPAVFTYHETGLKKKKKES